MTTIEQKAFLYDVGEAKKIIIKAFPLIAELNEFSQDNLAKFFVRQIKGEDDREKTINFVRRFETAVSMYEDAGHDLYDDICFETYESTFYKLLII